MCRFVLYKGKTSKEAIHISDLIVRPSHSIIRQSYACRERFVEAGLPPCLNGDGFGFGWFAEVTVDAGAPEKPLPPHRGLDPTAFRGSRSAHGSVSVDDSPLLTARASSGHVRGGKSQLRSPSGPHCARSTSIASSVGEPEAAPESHATKRVLAPGVFTSVTPAWNNRNLRTLAERIRSSLIFAHVRAASLGALVTDLNCHPFAHGQFMWMHNGMVSHFSLIRRRLMESLKGDLFHAVLGNTDSEHSFALFLSKLMEVAPLDSRFTPLQLQRAMAATIQQLDEWSKEAGITEYSLLNFAVTDGRTVLATRYVNQPGRRPASLYFSCGSQWAEDAAEPGLFRMKKEDRRENVVIVASERLTDALTDWVEVPRNHMVLVTEQMNVLLVPITSPPPIPAAHVVEGSPPA